MACIARYIYHVKFLRIHRRYTLSAQLTKDATKNTTITLHKAITQNIPTTVSVDAISSPGFLLSCGVRNRTVTGARQLPQLDLQYPDKHARITRLAFSRIRQTADRSLALSPVNRDSQLHQSSSTRPLISDKTFNLTCDIV
jgi:hypothetical protein